MQDLATRNIFRGRDLGYAGWKPLVACLGTTPGATSVPASVTDVFPHLLGDGEPAASELGATLHAIILDQFHRVFFASGGDWYEGKDLGQFEDEVRGSKLSQIINANSGANVQENVFYV